MLKAAPKGRGLLLAMLALAGCGRVSNEPFLSPYDKLSTPAGTIQFVYTYRTRACSWFECGESSFRYLGASLDAVLLHRGEGRALEIVTLGHIECERDNIAACEFGTLTPQLRRGRNGPELINSLQSVTADTLAFATLDRDAMAAGEWLCTADDLSGLLPAPPGVKVLKVMPDATLSQVAAVIYRRISAPADAAEAARCFDPAQLPRPTGADEKADVSLGDLRRNQAGQLEVVYKLTSPRDFTAGPLAAVAMRTADGWQMRQLDETVRGGSASPLFLPGFLDTTSGEVLLDIASSPSGQLEILLADSTGKITRPPVLMLPR